MHVRGPDPGSVAIHRREGGWCAEGPGFYVWDEDPREVARVAHDLRRGVEPAMPAQRMLIVPPQSGVARSE